eukprot:Gb_32570 [translate_table: standard]
MKDKRVPHERRTKHTEDLRTTYCYAPVIDDKSTVSAIHGLRKFSLDRTISTISQYEDKEDVENRNHKQEGIVNPNNLFLHQSTRNSCQASKEEIFLSQSGGGSKKWDRAKLFENQRELNRSEQYENHLSVESRDKLQESSKSDSGIFAPTKKDISTSFAKRFESEQTTSTSQLEFTGRNSNRTPMTPRTCYHTHLSGTGVAAALGLSKGVFNR